MAALRIEAFLKNCKKIFIKRKFQKLIYKLKSMPTVITNLPVHILSMVFEYLDLKEQFKYSGLCKTMKKVSEQPHLRKQITLRN